MKFKIYLFVALFLLLLSNCAVRKTAEGEKVITIEPSTTKVDTLRPQTFDTTVKTPPITSQIKPVKKATGFRVQIFSFQDRNRAELAFNDAKLRLNMPVYLEEVPGDITPYKIRVGNFQTREEAERYRDFLRQNGYPDAFIVQCEIELP
ncbi:MAG: SPOR domain-containing protein [Candidatus Hydrothermia bacterium]